MEEKKKDLVQNNRYLTFFVDNEQYGVDISKIKEIIAPVNITAIPKAPDFVKGVINLRGLIIPIVDVRLKFDLEEKEIEMTTAIIIYEITGSYIGFIIDSVEDVLSLHDEQISEPPHFGNNIDTEFIQNVAEVNGNVIMLLNFEKIFEQEELLNLKKLEQRENKNVSEEIDEDES